MFSRIRSSICFASLFLTVAMLGSLWGQSTGGGSITGEVHDPSGAAVPNASVTVKSDATGVTLSTVSSSAGQFVFPVVLVGQYTLTVSAPGFSEAVLSDVIVALNKTTTEDIALKLGATTQTVEVHASAVQLDTTTAQASTGFDQNTYSTLPLALTGAPRSPSIFSDLMPGVADAPTNSTGLNEPGEAQIFSQTVNGGQTLASEVYYDGVAMLQTNVAGDYRYQPVPVDALQEFTLVQNNFSAEYSRTPGGILALNTRSGTDSWHGEGYEYNENAAFNSRGFFALSVPKDRQNEFGGNIGGPIKKGKAFLFAYYSGFRYSSIMAPALTTIPTLAEQAGDFSNYRDASGNVIPIYDPATTNCNAAGICTRQQFSYNGQANVIPPSRITSVAKQFETYIPTPSNANQNLNYLASRSILYDNYNRAGGKIDDYIGQKDVIHGLYGQSPYHVYYPTQVYSAPFSGIGFTEPDDSLVFRLSEDHTFAPNLLNHLTYGYNRDNAIYAAPRDFTDITFGIANIPPVTPAFSLGQYGSAGWNDPGQSIRENGNAVSDFLSWVKGRHQLKFGGEFRRYADNTIPINSTAFNFATGETALPTNLAATGNEFASFLIGEVDSASQQLTYDELGARFNYLGAYIQDNFKVTRRLTLNLGLRYDIPWTRKELHNTFSSFEPYTPNPDAGGRLGALTFVGTGQYTCNCIRFTDTRFNNVQPRFGFAYEVNQKTVLRGGIGIFEGSAGDVLENGTRNSYADGFNVERTFASPNLGVTSAFNIVNGFPAYPAPTKDPSLDNGSSINYLAPQDGTPPRIVYWSLDGQRYLPGKLLLDIGYVANSAHHIASNLLDINQLNPQYLSLGNTLNAEYTSSLGASLGIPLPYPGFSGTVAQALLPYPQYLGGSIYQAMQTSGKSHYESLQVKLQRQFTQGLSVLVSYTFAKLMTTAESQHAYLDSNGGSQNAYNLKQELAPSASQPPQVLNLAYVYQLPFGNGKRFVNKSNAGSAILGGWQVSVIQRYQSGMPMNVEDPLSFPLYNEMGGLYPNIVAGQSLRASWSGKFDPAQDVYLNAAAFSLPANFTLGNAARNIPLRGFAYYNEDFGLGRNFRFKERMSLLISAYAFNVFNRTTFGGPDTYAPNINAEFGQIGNQANTPRMLQIAVDLKF